MRYQISAEAVKHLQLLVGIGDNLADEHIELRISGYFLIESLSFFLVKSFEAVHCRLHHFFHASVVRGVLPGVRQIKIESISFRTVSNHQ